MEAAAHTERILIDVRGVGYDTVYWWEVGWSDTCNWLELCRSECCGWRRIASRNSRGGMHSLNVGLGIGGCGSGWRLPRTHKFVDIGWLLQKLICGTCSGLVNGCDCADWRWDCSNRLVVEVACPSCLIGHLACRYANHVVVQIEHSSIIVGRFIRLPGLC